MWPFGRHQHGRHEEGQPELIIVPAEAEDWDPPGYIRTADDNPAPVTTTHCDMLRRPDA